MYLLHDLSTQEKQEIYVILVFLVLFFYFLFKKQCYFHVLNFGFIKKIISDLLSSTVQYKIIAYLSLIIIILKRFFQRKLHKILHRTKEGDKWQYMISNKTLKIDKEKRKKKKEKRKKRCHSLLHPLIPTA